MYDPNPNQKDAYVITFEQALAYDKRTELDDELREQIRQQLSDTTDTISSDK